MVKFMNLSAAIFGLRRRLMENALAIALERHHLRFTDGVVAASTDAEFRRFAVELVDFGEVILDREVKAGETRAGLVRLLITRLIEDINNTSRMQRESLKTAYEGIRKAIA